MHFPIEVLRDKIKDLFETAVPKDTHMDSFEYGLSHGLKFHQTDLSIAQSADNDSGYEGTDSQYKTFLHIYDNVIQFLWMLTYSAYISHDASLYALTTSNRDEALQSIADLRIAYEVYSEAIRMLKTNDSDFYMKASRGHYLHSLIHIADVIVIAIK